MRGRRKGLAVIQVLIVLIFVMSMLLVLTAIIFNKAFEDQRVIVIQRDITATKALFSATERSLGETWEALSTQIIFDVLEVML